MMSPPMGTECRPAPNFLSALSYDRLRISGASFRHHLSAYLTTVYAVNTACAKPQMSQTDTPCKCRYVSLRYATAFLATKV
jgi:hypothetical protein